jgi:hypothetical protein
MSTTIKEAITAFGQKFSEVRVSHLPQRQQTLTIIRLAPATTRLVT